MSLSDRRTKQDSGTFPFSDWSASGSEREGIGGTRVTEREEPSRLLSGVLPMPCRSEIGMPPIKLLSPSRLECDTSPT